MGESGDAPRIRKRLAQHAHRARQLGRLSMLTLGEWPGVLAAAHQAWSLNAGKRSHRRMRLAVDRRQLGALARLAWNLPLGAPVPR